MVDREVRRGGIREGIRRRLVLGGGWDIWVCLGNRDRVVLEFFFKVFLIFLGF